MVDTNTDPDDIDVIIPLNDDASCAGCLITQKMADAIIEGNQGEEEEDEEEQQPAADKKAEQMEDIVEAVEGDNKRAN